MGKSGFDSMGNHFVAPCTLVVIWAARSQHRDVRPPLHTIIVSRRLFTAASASSSYSLRTPLTTYGTFISNSILVFFADKNCFSWPCDDSLPSYEEAVKNEQQPPMYTETAKTSTIDNADAISNSSSIVRIDNDDDDGIVDVLASDERHVHQSLPSTHYWWLTITSVGPSNCFRIT